MKFLVLCTDAFFLMRPIVLIPVWGFSIFGLNCGMHRGHDPRSLLAPLQCGFASFLWLVVFSLGVACVYVLNQIADVNVDKYNNGTPLLARGKVSATVAWVTAATCAAVSICVPLFVYPKLSIFSAAAILLGVAYSFPPVRFSGRCFLDFLANGMGYGIIAFGAGWYFSGADFVGFGFWLSAMPYFLLMCAGSISSTLPDYDGDKKCGKNTTAVVLGVKSAHVLATGILMAALIAGAVRGDTVAMMCAACSLPFYVFYYVKPGRRSMEATYKVGGVLCMVFAAVLLPVAALTALCVGLLTWLYFKLRHHTNYPSLVPERHDE